MSSKRKMPIKLVTLDFAEDDYEGFTCQRRLNLRMGTINRLLRAETEETSRQCWLEIFPEWDFVDEDGEPIPHTADGIDLIPQDLWNAMLRRGNEAMQEAAMPDPLGGNSSKPGDESRESSDEGGQPIPSGQSER